MKKFYYGNFFPEHQWMYHSIAQSWEKARYMNLFFCKDGEENFYIEQEIPYFMEKIVSGLGYKYEIYNNQEVDLSPFTGETIGTDLKTLNSKLFSYQLNKKYNLESNIHVSSDFTSLKKAIDKLFKFNDKVVLKTEFGTSGRGNFLQNDKNIPKKIELIIKEEFKNKRQIIIEPFHDIITDFSSLWKIDDEQIDFLCFTKMNNKGFQFREIIVPYSLDLPQEEIKYYVSSCMKILADIQKEGFRGELSIDSAITKEGKMIKLFEINCRKTMGILAFSIMNFLKANQVSICTMSTIKEIDEIINSNETILTGDKLKFPLGVVNSSKAKNLIFICKANR
ncbi:MAG: hypothetical protein JXR48_04955 [Candidatus Delongbacteria bacterium]|nr:hypothetical protein [Candidatus Delongbacteria bacterium]MBN2834297.1 hypothetical protein [Candidatus Delongbacteria bacterium]